MKILYGCPFDKIQFLTKIDSNSGCTGSIVSTWQFLKWHFWPVHGIWSFLCSNTFIWSAINVPLLHFFHNVSQSLPNPEFVSILVKNWILSKGHPYSIFILVSYCSPTMLASFKSKIRNVFCPAIFLHFRMVWCR